MKTETLMCLLILVGMMLAVWVSIATCEGVLVRGLFWFQCIPWRTLG